MLTSVEWNNDPVLGNLKLNFTREDGTPYKNIVIAGENGTGKTRILQTLSSFLNLESIVPFKEICYEISGVKYTITPYHDNPQLGFHNRKKDSDGSVTAVFSNISSVEQIQADPLDVRHYGCAYSRARSGFKTKPIKSSTTEQLDAVSYDNDENDDFTSIKQLIVDIKSQDNSVWDKIGARGENIPYAEFHRTSKIYRFEKAFNDFFESIQFTGVDEEAPGEKKVAFSKNGHAIAIDDLSTGEKQVVFRGAQLLRNSRNLNGGVILIDEPELSMHPKWQSKIFGFYTGLFSASGSQTAQIIFATHSENVIRAAVQDTANTLIIILADENGIITSNKIADIVLPNVTAAEINYLAFGVKSIDYHIALYGDFQVQTSKSSIAAADSCIASQPEYIPAQHEKIDTYRSGYTTLPTYIRNKIDHPDSPRRYTDEEFEKSILLLRAICKRLRTSP